MQHNFSPTIYCKAHIPNLFLTFLAKYLNQFSSKYILEVVTYKETQKNFFKYTFFFFNEEQTEKSPDSDSVISEFFCTELRFITALDQMR